MGLLWEWICASVIHIAEQLPGTLSFHLWVLFPTQVVKHGSKCVYSLSHVAVSTARVFSGNASGTLCNSSSQAATAGRIPDAQGQPGLILKEILSLL